MMPRKKSPRAPSISLDEALDRTFRVYERERLHPAPTDLVAQALGYKSANNGTALGVMASLRYFGLLVRPKEGVLAVSKEVEAYKFAPDESLRRSILVSFLKRPPLYLELLEKYESGLPSDANLLFELIQQRAFSPQAAEAALVAFRKSVDFVGFYDHRDAITAPAPAVEGVLTTFARSIDHGSDSRDDDLQSELFQQPKIQENSEEPASHDRIPVRLPGGRKAWLIIPVPFFEADKMRLKAQIDLLLTEEDE